MEKANPGSSPNAAQMISNQIAELDDWRGKMLAQLRELVREADPDITEEWKWGSAVWTHQGMVCSAGVFKDHLKLNFFKGASLEDPQHLFNAGLEAKATRAIDFHQGDPIDKTGLQSLIRAAVTLNRSGVAKK
jgi:hypothetical protein